MIAGAPFFLALLAGIANIYRHLQADKVGGRKLMSAKDWSVQ